MCLQPTVVRGLSRWNWDGGAVVFDPIVPSSRPVVGGKRHYAVDAREFLTGSRNAIIRRTLEKDVREWLAGEPGAYDRFTSRLQGSFDHRAAVVRAWVANHVAYSGKRGRDPWQFPGETLAIKKGDCEDRAFLIASLLLASGVSGYHVRVALGHVRTPSGGRFDHAWVMYKNEAGRWILVEPLHLPRAKSDGKKKPTTKSTARAGAPKRHLPPSFRPHDESVEYVPRYLFNDEHLWMVPARSAKVLSFQQVAAANWARMNPKFAGEVHRDILHRALADIAPAPLLQMLDGRFTPAAVNAVGPLVDASDRGSYDPRDHFDNGMIKEGWALVAKRLGRFRADRSDYLAFAQAAHGIADFYAHSSYLSFASVTSPMSGSEPHAEPFDPSDAIGGLGDAPYYGPNPHDPELARFDLTSNRFSINTCLWKKGKQAAADFWDGKIITGRYGQAGDSQGDVVHKWFIEGKACLPPALATPERGALPHHNEIAVDGPEMDASHRLFGGDAYAMQYRWRFNTAALHIRRAFQV